MHRLNFKKITSFTLSILLAFSCIIFPITSLSVSAANSANEEKQITVNYNYQVVDTFCGVPAKYILGYSDTGDYCCAAYVSNFYKQLFGVTVYGINIWDGMPAVWEEGCTLKEVTNVRPGDIMQTKDYTHVAIVKAVDGDEITLIEQNYKWTYEKQVYTIINRKILKKNYYFYRLYKNGKEQTINSAQNNQTQSNDNNSSEKKPELQSAGSASPDVKLNKTSLTLKAGQSQTLTATLSTGGSKGIMWKSGNTSAVKVNNGKITAAAAGVSDITAYTSAGKKAVCRVTVKDSITAGKISVSSAVYTGKKVTPTVKITYNGRNLVKGKDFTVSSKYASIGSAKAVIKGIGYFSGTKTVKFTIKPPKPTGVKISEKSGYVKLSWKKVKGAQGYIVSGYNSKTKKWIRIYKGKSTSVKYSAAKYDKYRVTAYKKVKNKAFYSAGAIVTSKLSNEVIKANKPEQAYFVGAVIKNGKITFTFHAQEGISGREVYMSDAENGTYKKVKTTGSSTTDTVTAPMYTLKYFKVRAFKKVSGKTVYGDFSKPMAVWVN